MPPIQNQPIKSPELNPIEDQKQTSPEVIPVQTKEQVPEKPVSKEAPKTETFSDAQTKAPAQKKAQPAGGKQSGISLPDGLEEKEAEEKLSKIDSQWVAAVDTVIEKDKEKPYEEEEDSEKLQIDYLFKRFGKRVAKE